MKPATVKKFVKVSGGNYFLRECQTKKRVFILLSFWVRQLTVKAGSRTFFYMVNAKNIKNDWQVVDPCQEWIRFLSK